MLAILIGAQSETIGEMMISAQVVCDSLNLKIGKRATTLVIKFPRFILPEVLTHRVFSRNTSSSRAIPTSKLIEQVKNNPVIPSHLGKNKSGMSAEEEISKEAKERVIILWLQAAENARLLAESMLQEGLHKQVVNRVLEPFLYTTMIVTSVDFSNFFNQRIHENAQPEIHELAMRMREAINFSRPTSIYQKNHFPFVSDQELLQVGTELAAKSSAARCARVSYLNHDGSSPSVENDLKLYYKLANSTPIHGSPLEHVLFPTESSLLCKNTPGFLQLRTIVEQEIKDIF